MKAALRMLVPNTQRPVGPSQESLVLQTAMAMTSDLLEKKFDTIYHGTEHPLLTSLTELRKQIQTTYQHDQINQWTSEGFGIFIDILRKDYSELSEFAEITLFSLVRFLGMEYGGFYVLNDESQPPHLELTACFSLNKKRYNPKRFEIGEGIVGQAFMDGEKVYFTDIPDNGLRVVTAMLQVRPKSILAVPLKNDFGQYGVIELASLSPMQPYKIHFVEELCKNIATALSSTKNAIHTKKLLETTSRQAAVLQAQEEELRLNLEELMTTQEEMKKKQTELERIKAELEINQTRLQDALDKTQLNEQELKIKNEELQAQEEEMRQNLEELITTQEEMRKKQAEQQALQTKLQQNEGILKKALEKSKAAESELQSKNQQILSQEEELRQNLEELSATQEEMRKKQLETERANQKLSANEAILKKALEKSKTLEAELNSRNQQILSQEEELRQNLEELSATQEEMQKRQHEIEKANERLSANEAILIKALEKSKTLGSDLAAKDQQNALLTAQNQQLNQTIEALKAEIEQLKSNR